MPQMDAGQTDGPPGPRLKTVSVTLSVGEAQQLLEALRAWAEDVAGGHPDPDWHAHLDDSDGNELTLAIELSGDDS
jgi:hypothetical protein